MVHRTLPDESILIVVGSTLRAEDRDRPLAYFLREKIIDLNGFGVNRSVYVVSDYRYLHETELSHHPTISVGGPGVNAVAHKWLDDLPVAILSESEFFLQLSEPDDHPARASVWGIDHEATCVAVSTFAERLLSTFLGIVSEEVVQGNCAKR